MPIDNERNYYSINDGCISRKWHTFLLTLQRTLKPEVSHINISESVIRMEAVHQHRKSSWNLVAFEMNCRIKQEELCFLSHHRLSSGAQREPYDECVYSEKELSFSFANEYRE